MLVEGPPHRFTTIILSRISVTKTQPLEQAEFEQGFRCMVHDQTVFRAVEVHRKYHLSLGLTFVDYKKTFDSVETNAVLSAVVDHGVDSFYKRTLYDRYQNYTTKIQLFLRPLTILIRKGVHESDEISPKLFNAALQWKTRSLDWNEKSMRISGNFLPEIKRSNYA
ncbi:unnamed protein product [Angiostrongylus costaricensis]|uniref:Reverse transcriptase domain-containing protein n=1 Tax=Angiostrongylus costaricensis TaxID=334426 RepID=A0A0R3PNF4_ANGCS|nr:unnamed protein product [Angiostrongylus costaricensis]